MSLVEARALVTVLLERRQPATIWGAPSWHAAAVLDDAPAFPSWTRLREGAVELWTAGQVEVRLFSTDTPNYRHNLETPADAGGPRAFVVLRTPALGGDVVEGDRPILHLVTVDPGEAHHHVDTGFDQMDSVPMPAGLLATLQAFVQAHHVERAFHKRRRDRVGREEDE